MSQNAPWVESAVVDVDYGASMDDRYADLSNDIAALGRHLLGELLQHVPEPAKAVGPLAEAATGNRFDAEILALSKAIGAQPQDVLIANLTYDLAQTLYGCSTVALPTPSGPVVARNMDWPQQEVLARCSCLIRYMKNGELVFANAGWPGAVGVVTGQSGNGFAVVLNAVSSPEVPRPASYPVLLHLRRVLEDATNFDEALQMLANQEITSSALITLVGTENRQRVVIERTPTKHALRWAEADQPLVTTNDYRLLYDPVTRDGPEIYQTTCQRFEYLTSCFNDHSATDEVSVDQMLYALTDINVLQSITAQHIVMHPATGDARLFVPRHLLQQD